MVWYTGEDKKIFDSGIHYRPRQEFLLTDYEWPIEGEGEVEGGGGGGVSYGIPAASVGGGGGNNVGPFTPYTAQPSGSYVTNRSSIGNTGYIQGTEPEETYMDKIGGLVKKGIGMAIPGANFLMGMVPSREKRLSAVDNAFIDMQLANQEQSMHGGNLTNQDRYGYNKVSMFGNYADLVSKHAAKAKNKDPEDRTDFDKYYMEKEEEQDEINKQIDFNDFMNQRITANKIRDLQAKGIDLYPDGGDIHGGDDTTTTTTTTTDQTGSGDGYTGSGDFSNVDNSGKDYGPHSKSAGSTQHGSSGMTKDQHDAFRAATGGRVYLNLGGIASVLGTERDRREGLAPGGPAGGASAGGNYGGNVNPEQEYAGSTFEETYGGDGGGGEVPPTVAENRDVVDVDWLTTKPELNINLDRSKYLAQLDLIDSIKKQELEGQIGATIGPVDFTTMINQGDIGNTNINYGNWSADISPNADINQVSYNRNIGDWDLAANYGGDGNYGIKFSKSYKHGGLASIL